MWPVPELGEAAEFAEISLIDVAVSDKPNSAKTEMEIKKEASEPLAIIEKNKYDLVPLWRHDQILLGRAMEKTKISTTSFKSDEENRLPDKIIVEDTDSCWEVLLSILLETFGIDSMLKGKFFNFINESKLENLAKDIMAAAKAKEWTKTNMLLRKFLTKLANPKTLELLKKIVGEPALERILKTFGSKLVPWFGWIILAASLVTSLWTNWNRLEKCEF